MNFPFDNSYAKLPGAFYARLAPTPTAMPGLIKLNVALAEHLGLDAAALTSQTGAEIFSGNRLPGGADPIALAYAGHQFGGWSPQLGDGRAILLGEVIDRDGIRRDVQLKGSGRTPFSRGGDGRAWLGPVLREYVLSEAMAALGVPTTRALAATTTGDWVYREDVLPGAVLTRIASSHIRVGTFQYFAARNDFDSVRVLLDYAIDRHDPAAREADNPALAMLHGVVARQAQLIAHWMSIGFIHGVMNTDNSSISGETIDYGPCAFMDTYHPDTVYSFIDRGGRYAYQRQPEIAAWNLSCLAMALLPLIDEDEGKAVEQATTAVGAFSDLYKQAYADRFAAKLGLATPQSGDAFLILDLLNRMAVNGADFTLTFRRLADLSHTAGAADDAVRGLFAVPTSFDDWAKKWRDRLAMEPRPDVARQAAMRAVNPAFIARNHRVEQMITAAVAGDFQPFETLLDLLSRPFVDQPAHADYQNPPEDDEVVENTFCGT